MSSLTDERLSADNETRGSARDVLANPAFRRLFLASFASNVGRWMQFAALGVLGWQLTGSSAFLGQLIFAQLVPLGFLSLLGGSLADTVDRRILLAATQAWQMGWTAVLAVLVIDDVIGPNTLTALVFVIGLGQGLFAPAFTSVLPLVAGEENIGAAISLNSVQSNGARVVGPAIGGFLTSRFGFAEVFAFNAVTYLLIIAVLIRLSFPESTASPGSFRQRILGGFDVVRRAPQVGRPIMVMAIFALCCLPFIGQLPAIAEVNLGVDGRSTTYGWFYATFGLGALVGAALVGTVLLRVDKPRLVRICLLGFAAALAALATAHTLGVAFPAVFAVAVFYLVMPTSLATLWQQHVDSSIRGRVAAIWVLSFGGMIPIANLVAGRVVEATSLDAVLLAGAVAAVVLAVVVRLPEGPVVTERILIDPGAEV